MVFDIYDRWLHAISSYSLIKLQIVTFAAHGMEERFRLLPYYSKTKL